MNTLRTVIVETSRSPHAALRPVPIEAVQLEDNFWAPRMKTLREVTLPSQYELLEETGRINNFRRAAGKISGDFQGLYFNDSDVYKWLEACAYALAQRPDPQIEELAERVIAEIADAQEEDGYLNTYFTFERAKERWSNLRDMHELYCAGHLFQAAVAYHRATGRSQLLEVAVRFADLIVSLFGPGKKDGVPGHPEIEMALVELYRETGEERYLRLAQFFIDRRGHRTIGGHEYHQDHRPFRELREVVGHAVRALYLNAGATDLYLETGDETLMAPLEQMWANMVQRRMYITGGVGARYAGEAFGADYELPNATAYAETCAAIANIFWNWRMLQAKPESRFAELIELAAYNGALSGISLDGKQYFYVNPLAARERHRRQRWFTCACCPPNIARLLGQLPGMVYSTDAEGFWVHLYASSQATLSVGGSSFAVRQETDYPWDGRVVLRVDPESPTTAAIRLRVPEWCPAATLLLNDEPVGGRASSGQYLTLNRLWQPGDRLELRLEMPVRYFVAHPLVEADGGKVAIRRGPLVYCLEGHDQVEDPWCTEIHPVRSPNVRLERDLLNGVAVITLPGSATELESWNAELYRDAFEDDSFRRPVVVRAIPYYAWANREPSPMTVWIRRTPAE
ncbi:MAG: hypothetical protein KatS3mg115_1146 [Candidatus Poribacteria bacterium]|nr:MAG: hypothetical protein KatS3mg115_1146 [Candidatus Poribacteria bacterium]